MKKWGPWSVIQGPHHRRPHPLVAREAQTMTPKHITMTEQAKAMTLARYYAKRNVKEEWRRQRKHWVWIEASELTKASMAYLAEHPELIEEAKRSLIELP
jgi:hypothetical protein